MMSVQMSSFIANFAPVVKSVARRDRMVIRSAERVLAYLPDVLLTLVAGGVLLDISRTESACASPIRAVQIFEKK